jgi:hypothetical protein
MAEGEEPGEAARRLEQELNNIAGLIDQSPSQSGPTLAELIRKLDQIRTDAPRTCADPQTEQAPEDGQEVMLDRLVSSVRAANDPDTLRRALEGLYASRDADETHSQSPAAYSDYSSGDDLRRRPGQSSNEPSAPDDDAHEAIDFRFTGYTARGLTRDPTVGSAHQAIRASVKGAGHDDYIPVPQEPISLPTAGSPAPSPEDDSGGASMADAFYREQVPTRSRAIRRTLTLLGFVVGLVLLLAVVIIALH